MAVRIRLARHGRLHRPFFRVVAIDGRCHREGKTNEVLGSYDPQLKDKNLVVDIDRVKTWVEQGAQISLPLARLMKHQGYAVPSFTGKAKDSSPSKSKAAPTPKLASGAAKGKYGTASRRAVKAHQAKLKAARKAEAAKATPAAEAPKA